VKPPPKVVSRIPASRIPASRIPASRISEEQDPLDRYFAKDSVLLPHTTGI
jgi:hypothetical protein